MADNKAEKDRNKRIKAEFDRIIVYFEDLDENEKAVLLPLIQNAAFMRVTLEDLQELIKRDGVIDYYQNGANQSGLKQSAALQSYNLLIKNYASVIKSLGGFLPYKQTKLPALQPRPQAQANYIPGESEEERTRRINDNLNLASEYQKWSREQKGHVMSFDAWKEQRGKAVKKIV